MPGVENRMVAGFWMPPQTQPIKKCSCGTKATRELDGEKLCSDCWRKKILADATEIECAKFIDESYADFVKYAESWFTSDDLIMRGIIIDREILMYTAIVLFLDTSLKNELEKKYIRDCDRSAFAEQIEKWRKL